MSELWKIAVRRFVCDHHDDCDMIKCRRAYRRFDRTYTDPVEVIELLEEAIKGGRRTSM